MADALSVPLPPEARFPHFPAAMHPPAAPRRLVVVSNRLALPRSTQTGGLATALRAALSESGGTWVGWCGEIGTSGISHRRHGAVDYHCLEFSKEEFEQHYLGFSNRVLWPLLHSRPDLLCYQPGWYQRYLSANQRFADAALSCPDPDAAIWVHDYQLLPLAGLLRRRRPDVNVGFFLHTPFPAPDIARCLPHHEKVFGALRHYDLVGVQTERDAWHLRAYLSALDPRFDARRIRAFPIGVDPDDVAAAAEQPSARVAAQRVRNSLASRQLILGVDRLDYSKGLPARFRAYERLLERHPDLCRQVSYLQIAPISRGQVDEYLALKHELDTQAGAINARHGDVDWVPLRYVARSHSQEVVAALMREASVGLVTPLRDGMNLVAKEYVAAQTAEDPGVLVLSEFAGAAETMQDALVVNPHDPYSVADAIALALRMPLAERRRRWESLMQGLQECTLSLWRQRFVQALAECGRPARTAPAGART